jgi:hypothetical protein
MELQTNPENRAAEKLSAAIVLLALEAAAQVGKPLYCLRALANVMSVTE